MSISDFLNRIRAYFQLLPQEAEPSPAVPEDLPIHEEVPPVSAVDRIVNDVASLTTEEVIEVVRKSAAIVVPVDQYFYIPSFQMRERPVTDTTSMQNEHMIWDIEPGETVLDIGCGGRPFDKATHLADRYPGETSHRFEPLKLDQRPFTVLDVASTPFTDKSFDFVFCSHVLEHLENPGDAIREIQRIGTRGYIEVPSRLSDVLMNFTHLPNHHKWHGLRLGQTLVLIEWQDDERRSMGTNYFFDMAQSSFQNPFQEFMEQNWDMFFVGLQWQDKIPFMIIGKDGKVLDRSE